jgi:hypothetical protein
MLKPATNPNGGACPTTRTTFIDVEAKNEAQGYTPYVIAYLRQDDSIASHEPEHHQPAFLLIVPTDHHLLLALCQRFQLLKVQSEEILPSALFAL